MKPLFRSPHSTPPLRVRDQAVLCAFFGVSVGLDTERWPELSCAASLSVERLACFRSQTIAGTHWSLLRLTASRSGAASITPWALVRTTLDPQGERRDDPALYGAWWIDENTALPRNDGTLFVTPGLFPALPVSDAAEAERQALAAEFGPELLGPVGWHVLALVDRKHT